MFISPSYHPASGWQGIVNTMYWLLAWIVRLVTQSMFAHAAVIIDLGEGETIVEAIYPQVCVSPVDKYDYEAVVTVVTVPVTTEQYTKAVAMARSLVGHLYGLDDCLIGAIHDLLGDEAANIVKQIDAKGTVDCSAVVALIIRCAFPDFMAGHATAEVTPQGAYEEIITLPGAEIVESSAVRRWRW